MERIKKFEQKHGNLVFFVKWNKPTIVVPERLLQDEKLHEVMETKSLGLRVATRAGDILNGNFRICYWWKPDAITNQVRMFISVQDTKKIFEFHPWLNFIRSERLIDRELNEFFIQKRIGRDYRSGPTRKVSAKDIKLRNIFRNISFEETVYEDEQYNVIYLAMNCSRTISARVDDFSIKRNNSDARSILLKIDVPKAVFTESISKYLMDMNTERIFKAQIFRNRIRIAECFEITVQKDTDSDNLPETFEGKDIVREIQENGVVIKERLGSARVIDQAHFIKKFHRSIEEIVGQTVLLGWRLGSEELVKQWNDTAMEIAREKIKSRKDLMVKELRASPFQNPINDEYIIISIPEVDLKMK